jgi:hypothetical protein
MALDAAHASAVVHCLNRDDVMTISRSGRRQKIRRQSTPVLRIVAASVPPWWTASDNERLKIKRAPSGALFVQGSAALNPSS